MIPRLKVVPPELAFVVNEVLEYDVPGLEFDKPPVVIDLGANIGAFTIWAQQRWPGAKVTAFEPHPANLEVLRQNLSLSSAHIDDRAVHGAGCGEATAMSEGPNLACVSSRWDRGGGRILAKTLAADLLGACDVLKLDIEGMELFVLRDYKHLAGCSAVLLEWHCESEVEEISAILTRAGLELYGHQRRELGGVPHGIMRWVKPGLVKPEGKAEGLHLFLATLGWKHSPFYSQSRERLVVACAEQGIGLTIHDNQVSGVDRARNISIEKARAEVPDFTHFMFIDSDLAFDAGDILAMMHTGLDVVGGAYPKKVVNWELVEAAVKRGVPAAELAKHANDFVVNGAGKAQLAGLKGDDGRRYAEVEELGTGFLMLTRRCIEQYIEHWRDEIAYVTDYEPRGVIHHGIFMCQRDPACEVEAAARALHYAAIEFHGEHGGDAKALSDVAQRYRWAFSERENTHGRYLTEDYAFCRRWRMMGGKVHCAIDARLMHQGPTIFQGELGLHLAEVAQ